MAASFAFFPSRRFLPLFCTQFLGALNDNLLKTAFLVLVSYAGLSFAGLPPEQIVNLAAAVFILPFFLFSATAGRVAEKLDKARVARAVKLAEVAIMVLAAWGFYTQHVSALLLALFLMGTHSTFFGPVKYAVLPQYLKGGELIGGNGLIEMGTFVAILVGQIGGALLVEGGHHATVGVLVAVALLGWLASAFMPVAPATAPQLQLSANVWRDTWQLMRSVRRYPEVGAAIMGISWFWLLGAVYTTQLPTFTRLHLGGNAEVYSVILALFSIGIAVGSVLCAKLSRGRLELGLVLLGGAGMTVFGIDLYLAAHKPWTGELLLLSQVLHSPWHWRPMADLFLLGLAGGFFTVPLYTWLQTAAPDEFRSQAIAANNIVNGLYMVAAAAASALILALTDSLALLFLLTALANVPALGRLCWRAPQVWQARWSWLAGLCGR
ncbi:MFS transporter [Laribacter hongkongensis]|uniref:MFS transporter n=1 Tax=Laribacter hongkongensis TaxID=168471 RepID=A0ABD4SQT6_9NEIS|nr:MFS transporter [Laribacter hongkongensis]MCG9025189.1 MFS transporter [Laribacter hongkongensis]MCG9099943.1 MFS transporter [Laribacter hongkongensis]MCG9104420.1 MFS transporter [Laribacter hongkongensis]MCG9111421.1 MFS transporter [Laribacter hongkongensis]MCG9119198.1 MFS transporter [Laribacter hongkongensis]